MRLSELNALNDEQCAAVLAGVLEQHPQYARQVAHERPYPSAESVAAAFAQVIQAASPDAQLTLIRAHPDLAGKAALAGNLTRESASEQASAGLDRLSPEEYSEFERLNAAYHERFRLPYVVCVREHSKQSIFEGARRRLNHSPDEERRAALYEIGRIARLRVLDLIDAEPGEEGAVKTGTPVRVKLGQNSYGKADVRLFKVFRDSPRHRIKDVWVRVALSGDFEAAHVAGDNTGLLATDTMRNTVYALARDGLTGSVENFGQLLIRHFVRQGPGVTEVTVTLTEHQWARLAPGGEPHDHAFVRQMPKHTATVSGDGQTFTVSSGLDELFILKTTQSGWAGFLRDEYTTLPETTDRILATVVNAHWEYRQPECDHDAVWQRVYDTLLATFGAGYSPSMQATLYRIGEAVLTGCPEISRIHFSFPNRHHIPYDLSRFGLDNPGTIFHADAEPYGLIEGWVERA